MSSVHWSLQETDITQQGAEKELYPFHTPFFGGREGTPFGQLLKTHGTLVTHYFATQHLF